MSALSAFWGNSLGGLKEHVMLNKVYQKDEKKRNDTLGGVSKGMRG